VNAGAGTITTTGTVWTGSLNANGDITFASSGGAVRKLQFAGVTDSGWVAFHAHDSSSNNPWYNAASAQNSVMELGVGDNLTAHADSVRIEGCMGIYLKAADRVISSAKIEARGGVDTLGNAIATTGAVTCGSLSAGTGAIQGGSAAIAGSVTAGSFNAGSGAIQTTGTLSAGSSTLGVITAQSVNAGSGSIQTTGAVTAGSLSAGTGSIIGGSATVATLAATNLSVSGTVTSDISFASTPGTRKLLFAGVSDGAWISYIAHDSSANNPWLNAYATPSTQNSVLEIGVGDDLGAHADSIRIDGCAGIYLEANDRVISSCKIEARGGLDALGNAIATTGAVTCGSLNAGAIQTTGSLAAGTCTLGAVSASSVNAGSGTIATTGALQGGVTTLGATTTGALTTTSVNVGSGTVQTTGAVACGSLNAGAGAITTTGNVSTGTLSATGATTLAMTTITAPAINNSYSVGTELLLKGAAVSITGTHTSASGLWGSYSRGAEGGDLVLTAGDGKSVGNNGSALSTINGGSVVIRAGRASTDSSSAGTVIRTYAGAIRFQCGSLQQINNLDAATYVTEMILQNNRLGVGTDNVTSRSETLQVAGSVYASGGAIVGSINAGSGTIQTSGAVTAGSLSAGSGAITGGSATVATLAATNLSVSGTVTSDISFASTPGTRRTPCSRSASATIGARTRIPFASTGAREYTLRLTIASSRRARSKRAAASTR
jgi:trimeric autotransporter adhesin